MAAVDDRDVEFLDGDALLRGILSVPSTPKGVVVFAHGSGSNAKSPRNAETSRALNAAGYATLRADLLTAEETALNAQTGQFRFDVATLARRMVAASTVVGTLTELQMLPLAYFGASTGAAAALTASVKRRDVYAVISRGGRPDLATCLTDVRAPTLLIVGGADVPVIPLNEFAYRELTCEKSLTLVPDAGHLFDEPGTMQRVAELTVDWLDRFRPGAGA